MDEQMEASDLPSVRVRPVAHRVDEDRRSAQFRAYPLQQARNGRAPSIHLECLVKRVGHDRMPRREDHVGADYAWRDTSTDIDRIQREELFVSGYQSIGSPPGSPDLPSDEPDRTRWERQGQSGESGEGQVHVCLGSIRRCELQWGARLTKPSIASLQTAHRLPRLYLHPLGCRPEAEGE